nr:TonB-dependent receptor [Acidobacteriota bacterium]
VWEGPFGTGSKGSWLLAARKSYIDWILRRVETSIDGSFGFTDAQAKLTLTPTPAQTLRVSFIGGVSELDEEDDDALNAFDRGRSHTIIGNVQWRFFPSPKWSIAQQLYVVDSRYLNRVADGRAREEGRDRDLTWRGTVEFSPSAQHFVDAGVQAQALDAVRVDRRFTSPSNSVTERDARPSTSAQAAWLSYRWTPIAGITVTPGVRMEHWRVVDETDASPWILAEWQLAPATRLRGGVAIQRQAPGLDETLVAQRARLVPERARIVDLGIEQRFAEAWRLSVTGYHRAERDRLRVMFVEPRLVNGSVVRDVVPPLIDNVLSGTGRGLEATFARRSTNGLSGWLSYAWGDAENTDRVTGEAFAADWDQTHTVNTSVAYRWSARSSISARYRYGSNFPLQGYLAPLTGDTHTLTEQRNVGRLPRYSRLDVRGDRAFTFRKSRLTLFAEVVNLLNQNNYRSQSARLDLRTGAVFGLLETLFPLLPSIGVLVEF